MRFKQKITIIGSILLIISFSILSLSHSNSLLDNKRGYTIESVINKNDFTCFQQIVDSNLIDSTNDGSSMSFTISESYVDHSYEDYIYSFASIGSSTEFSLDFTFNHTYQGNIFGAFYFSCGTFAHPPNLYVGPFFESYGCFVAADGFDQPRVGIFQNTQTYNAGTDNKSIATMGNANFHIERDSDNGFLSLYENGELVKTMTIDVDGTGPIHYFSIRFSSGQTLTEFSILAYEFTCSITVDDVPVSEPPMTIITPSYSGTISLSLEITAIIIGIHAIALTSHLIKRINKKRKKLT